jgi:gliding motility-associated-like protein
LYYATVTDTITKCRQSDHLTIFIQDPSVIENISVMPVDTSIIIGEYVTVSVYDNLQRGFTYTWTPDDGQISCTNCTNPIIQPLENKIYKLEVSDPNYCFISKEYNVDIKVKEEYVIGVPDAFTPNGDKINDIIKVDGWGIKKLIEFRIFNRWGSELFYTDNIEQGWDGYYKDKLQPMDSYAYLIKAELMNNEVIVKKGTFSLIK